MRLQVLGCSGGIGGNHLRTTSFLVDHDILVDAGTGVGDLPLAELARIDHIFVTHSHLDHVASIPFLVDTVGGMRERPLTIHATAETASILRQHLFNWLIWPDFTQIPDPARPYMQYRELQLGQRVTIDGRSFTPLPAVHTVPAIGFHIESARSSLVFSGDTGPNDDLWRVVNRIPNLKYLIVETAFSDKERALAELSKHLCPSMLGEELAKLTLTPEVWITHLKPGEVELTMREIEHGAHRHRPSMLQNGQVFEF